MGVTAHELEPIYQDAKFLDIIDGANVKVVNCRRRGDASKVSKISHDHVPHQAFLRVTTRMRSGSSDYLCGPVRPPGSSTPVDCEAVPSASLRRPERVSRVAPTGWARKWM